MTNSRKIVYTWYVLKNEPPENMVFYKNGLHRFPKGKTNEELSVYLTDIADTLPEHDLYFAFRANGNIWKVFKTGEFESEHPSLFSDTI